MRGKDRSGDLHGGRTFRHAAQKFIEEFEIIAAGERSPHYFGFIRMRLDVHLFPFLGKKYLSEITPGLVQEYRAHRMTSRKHPKTGEPLKPARNTLEHEITIIRHVLRTAYRHQWLPYLPDLTSPYKTNGKIGHRAWFSPEEYKKLYQATRERAKNPKKEIWREASERFHDYVLFMGNTGLRPDEANLLQFRDVAIVTDEATGERILEIEVRGKTGVGYCKSMPGAVTPFERLKKRHFSQPDALPKDRLFGKVQRALLNSILDELDLKFDREGNRRTAYSLRHTYICMRLMDGANIYQVANNCRTSVEMIEEYYARHIKNRLDASQINVRKAKRPQAPE